MHLSTVILGLCSMLITVAGQLETAYEWRYIDYVWPSKTKRQEAIQSGNYNISEPLPMDIGVSQDGRIFMTMVSIKGVPARLGVITNDIDPASGPLLQPYPSWEWTDKNSCDAILKPLRIDIDKCNRLWVLDSADPGMGQPRNCHPKLLAFDLWTDTLVTNINIPENIAANAKTNRSLMATVKIETHGPFCEDTTVYMADALGNALVIWDGTRLFRIENPTFEPRPEATNFTIASDYSYEAVGILGLDISPRIFPNEPQYLYFRPMTSFGLFAINTDQLKNSIHGQPIEIFGANNVFTNQSISHAFSSEGTLFLGQVQQISLICWNRYRKLSKKNIVTIAQDSERLQYADTIKVIPESILGKEEIWVLSNRLVRHNHREVWDPREINYRILRSPVKDLIAGTKCEMPIEIRRQSRIAQDQSKTHFE